MLAAAGLRRERSLIRLPDRPVMRLLAGSTALKGLPLMCKGVDPPKTPKSRRIFEKMRNIKGFQHFLREKRTTKNPPKTLQ